MEPSASDDQISHPDIMYVEMEVESEEENDIDMKPDPGSEISGSGTGTPMITMIKQELGGTDPARSHPDQSSSFMGVHYDDTSETPGTFLIKHDPENDNQILEEETNHEDHKNEDQEVDGSTSSPSTPSDLLHDQSVEDEVSTVSKVPKKKLLKGKESKKKPVGRPKAKGPKKTFECEICGKVLRSQRALKSHTESHSKTFQCLKCDKVFTQKSVLRNHERIHTGEKPYQCDVCDRSFGHKSHLKRHVKTHTGEKTHCCTECGKGFSETSDLSKHMGTHMEAKPHMCDICAKSFSVITSLKQHMRTHTGQLPHVCAICDTRFNRAAHLQYHMHSIHTLGKPQRRRHSQMFKIRRGPECIYQITPVKPDQAMSDPDQAKETAHVQNDQMQYADHADQDGGSGTVSSGDFKQNNTPHISEDQSDLCEQRMAFDLIKQHLFSSPPVQPNAGQHLNTGHIISQQDTPTQDPDQAYSEQNPNEMEDDSHDGQDFENFSDTGMADPEEYGSETELDPESHTSVNIEVVSDNGDVEVQSQECDAADDSILDTPGEISTPVKRRRTRGKKEENTYACDKCTESFPLKRDLRTHLKQHKEKYQCEVCEKYFWQKGHLTLHERSHAVKKSYQCDTCGKSFRQSNHFKRHLRIHSDERPHLCQKCGKSFKEVSDLNKHIGIHTEDKPHKCDQCGKGFTLVSSLKQHIRTHTGQLPYCCVMCGKTFNRTSHLEYHMTTHSKESGAHTCPVCNKKYKVQASLRSHMMTHQLDYKLF